MNCVLADQEYCMSGCESGWTIYLEPSSISPFASEFIDGRQNLGIDGGFMEEEGEEEEDLSMVSDASSGPPQPHLHDGGRGSVRPEEVGGGGGGRGCYYRYSMVEEDRFHKRGREKRRRNGLQDQSSLLDDTASSPFFDFSDENYMNQHLDGNILQYSKGYSSTQFEIIQERPSSSEQYDSFESTESANQMQQVQWFEGKW